MDKLRKTYLKHFKDVNLTEKDYQFLAEELRITVKEVKDLL